MENEDNTIDLDDVDENLMKKEEDATHEKDTSKRKKTTSPIWDHFVIPNPVPKDNPRCWCKYCNKDYAYDPSKIGTSSLWTHISNQCKKYPLNNLDKKQKTLVFGKNSTGGDSLTSNIYNPELCRKALVRMIIVDELPFRFVEKEGFRYFCSVMQPKFGIPSRITIARDVISLYVEEKNKMQLYFSKSSQQVCLTTDTWTSIQNINYMVLTAHYIDDDWKLQKRILNFESISNHKGETIGKMIEACLIAWGIERVFTITVDNASSNDTAIAYMKKRIRHWKTAVLDCEFLHMRCCAHILNLVVTNGLKDYDESIQVIRNAVRFVRSSPSRLHKFIQCVEKEKLVVGGSVCLDVPTRWNSTYLMLESALKFRDAFERLKDDEQYVKYFRESSGGAPNEDDWDSANHFMKFLEIFFQATKRFSGSLYLTSNVYFHDLCSMYTHITTCIDDGDPKLSIMATEMKIKFDKYWGDLEKINPLLYIAVVLDPRYKQEYVDWSFKDLYGDNDFALMMSRRIQESLKNRNVNKY